MTVYCGVSKIFPLTTMSENKGKGDCNDRRGTCRCTGYMPSPDIDVYNVTRGLRGHLCVAGIVVLRTESSPTMKAYVYHMLTIVTTLSKGSTLLY